MSGWAVTYWCLAWCLTCQSKGLCSGWVRGDAQTRLYRSSEGSLIGWTQCLSQGWWPCLHLSNPTEKYLEKQFSFKSSAFFSLMFLLGINSTFFNIMQLILHALHMCKHIHTDLSVWFPLCPRWAVAHGGYLCAVGVPEVGLSQECQNFDCSYCSRYKTTTDRHTRQREKMYCHCHFLKHKLCKELILSFNSGV